MTEPALLFLEGTLRGHSIDQGTLTTVLGSLGWLPTLPDPYVSNRSRAPNREAERANPTLITATVLWKKPEEPALTFQGALAGPLGGNAAGTNEPARAVRQGTNQIRVPTQTAEGAVIGWQGAQPKTRSLDTQPGDQAELLAAFEGGAAKALGLEQAQRGIRLLDVSTNKDLLGVELTGQARAMEPLFQLRALDVCTPASALQVFALPQVQWEPVRTLERDQDIPHLGFFPTPLASVTDGGATRMAVQSVKLVPAIPDLATDAILQEFAAGQSAALLTTLPFGLRAIMQLRPRTTGVRSADTVMRNEPKFVQPDLQGGAQVAFIAESGPSGRDESSYFDGSAIQLRNGVALETGASLNISVLGSIVDPADGVEDLFNNEFGPGAPTARVPVTRLDMSGYGGSCFSDWMKRSAAFAEAAKVQFEVIVGRTALEVVKFATVLYPWGIRLTRTVTIERRGGGGIIRRDSGWQASSPGLFQFPPSAVPGTHYTVHPGLIRGLFNVTNIRSTGLAPISFMGRNGKTVALAPKFFDARVRIDGLEGGPDLPANGVLGFLQIAPIGEPLHEDDLRALLDHQGPMGGPIDGLVQVGGSGFRVRATRIEVGYALGATGRPELIGTIRSAPVFRQDGAWSAVRIPGPTNPNPDAEAVTANEVKGLPIVREGELVGVTGDTMNLGPQTDYRFADPADIHRPDDPVWEYGFLQTSSAHVFVYPRPHVDAGVREIRSRSVPRFADYYARCTSKGLFPPAANSITLAANALVVDATTGSFRLRDSVNMGAPRPPLIVAQRGSDVMQVDYSGATLSYSFNPTSWSLDMPGIEMWTDCLGVHKVAGLRSHLVAGTTIRPVVRDVAMLLQHDIEAALSFLTGFGSRPPMGPIDLGASNTVTEHKFTLAVDKSWEFPITKSGFPIHVKISAGGKAEFGWSTDSAPPPGTTSETTYDIGLLATAGVEGKIPVTSIGVATVYILLGAEIEIGGAVEIVPAKPAELKFDFDLKAFIGVGLTAGVFDGSVAIGYHLAIDGGTIKNGIFGKIEAEVDFEGRIGWSRGRSGGPLVRRHVASAKRARRGPRRGSASERRAAVHLTARQLRVHRDEVLQLRGEAMAGLFRLTILPYLADWDVRTRTLRLNVVLFPIGDPRNSLTIELGLAGPAMADASIALVANLSKDVDQLPMTTSIDFTTDVGLVMPANRRDVFDGLHEVFRPAAAELPPSRTAANTLTKYLTRSYRNAFAFVQPRTALARTDDAFRCMLHCPPPVKTVPKPPPDRSWAEVFANALRVPPLMRKAGLLHTVEVALPSDDFYASGGWLSFTLAPTSDYADAAAIPGFVRSFATRIPVLEVTKSRPVFTAVLFPVFPDAPSAAAEAGKYDAVFPEAETFDDGFAKIVHATQLLGMDHLDEDGSGPPPVADQGVQLGWDDEDVLIGQNRQMGLDPDGATSAEAPRGVAGYRVDVRRAGDALWTSLSAVHADQLKAGSFAAGPFDGELRTEVHPRKIYDKIWLPAYFASWTGGSMVVDTTDDKALRGNPAPKPPLFEAVHLDTPLRYGNSYEFRVRMVDASGGGPDLTGAPFTPGDSPVAVVNFRRFLPPKKLRIVNQTTDAAGTTLVLERPRIDYPAAVFADIANAVPRLRAIYDANAISGGVLQDVALPDPDAEFAEIRVMVRPPAFDRDGTSGGWRELYTTYRAFPDDPTDELTVAGAFVDVGQIGDMDFERAIGPDGVEIRGRGTSHGARRPVGITGRRSERSHVFWK